MSLYEEGVLLGHCRWTCGTRAFFFRFVQKTAGLKSSFTFLWHFWALWSNTEKSWLKVWVSNKLAAVLFLPSPLAHDKGRAALEGRAAGKGCHLENSHRYWQTDLSFLCFGETLAKPQRIPSASGNCSKVSCPLWDLPQPTSLKSCLSEMTWFIVITILFRFTF